MIRGGAECVLGIALLAAGSIGPNPWTSRLAVAPWLPLLALGLLAAALGRGARFALPAGVLSVVALIPLSPRAQGTVAALALVTLGFVALADGLRRVGVLTRLGGGVLALAGSLSPGSWRTLSMVVAFATSALFARVVLGGLPHVVDAQAQWFHARMLLDGRAWISVPEAAHLFRLTHMVELDGRWFSQYPPGPPLLAAAGLGIGVPWLVPPTVGALAVAALHALARRTHDADTAKIAGLLAATSPFFLVTNGSFLSHAATGLLLCVWLVLYLDMAREGNVLTAFLAGCALGGAAAFRPWTAAAVGLPCAVAYLFSRMRPRCALAVFAGAAFPVAGVLAWNAATTGDPFLFGYEAAHGTDALPGFGAEGWWGRPHTLRSGAVGTWNNANALQQYLLALPVPALLPCLLALGAGRHGRLLLAIAASVAAAYFVYWYQDWTYGPRFLYSAAFPLWVLAAAGLRETARRFGPRLVTGACALGGMCSIVVFLAPLVAYHGRNYADGNAEVARAVSAAAPRNAVVMVPDLYYPGVFPLNRPGWPRPEDPVLARDAGEDGARLLEAAFPERVAYCVRSRDRYRVERWSPGPFRVEVRTGTPAVFETLGFQAALLSAAEVGHRKTGALGAGWRNHDELRIGGDAPGARAGFLLDADRTQERVIRVRMGHGPRGGTVRVSLNGVPLGDPVDTHAPREGVREHTFDATFEAGANGLEFEVVGRSVESARFEVGLDEVRVE